MNVGENIAKIRTEQGISQRELARRIGMSGQMISKIENDLSMPSLETLNRIAEGLNVNVSDLLEEKILTLKPEIIFSGPGKVKGRDNKHFKRELVKYLEENDVKNSKELANNILKHIEVEIEINKE